MASHDPSEEWGESLDPHAARESGTRRPQGRNRWLQRTMKADA
jgi:hypothetical protein